MTTIQKLDIQTIDDTSRIYIVSKRDCGKSFLIKDIMFHKKYLSRGKAISQTQPNFFKEFINETDVYDKFDKSLLKDTNDLFLIFDDCIYDLTSNKIILKNKINNLKIITTSYFMMSNKINWIFLFKDNNINNLKKIYNFFKNIFPSFETFLEMFNLCTNEDYKCMVIHYSNSSQNIYEKVFFYKADRHNDFIVGLDNSFILK
jgi:hypothetical protein